MTEQFYHDVREAIIEEEKVAVRVEYVGLKPEQSVTSIVDKELKQKGNKIC